MKKTILFYLLLALIFYSCGGAGEVYHKNITKSHAFDNPIQNVWESVISVFSELNFPIRTMDRTSGFIQSERVIITESEIYKYTTTKGVEYEDGAMSFAVFLKDEGEKVSVTINSDFIGTWKKVDYYYVVTETSWARQKLFSNGKYEQILFKSIQENLAK